MDASSLRRWVLGIHSLAASGCVAAYPLAGSTAAQWVLIFALLATGLLLAAIAGEADARPHAPVGPTSLLRAPLVPGGGRGAAFVLLVLAMDLGAFLAARAAFARGELLLGDDDPVQLLAIVLFALSYALLFGHVARLPGVRAAPWLALVLFATLWFAAMFFGEGRLDAGLQRSDGPVWAWLLAPMSMLEQIRQDGSWLPWAQRPFELLVGISGALLLLELPRMVGGVRALARPRSGRGGPVSLGDAP